MTRLNGYFDRSGKIRRPSYGRLWGEGLSFIFEYPKMPDPAQFSPGDGHIVLVLPGYLTPDANTWPLRRFLKRCGYRAFGWGMGVNFGPTPKALGGLRRRFGELRDLSGGPISLIGVSLGGLFARNLAFDQPDDVCHVITLVSPFRLPTASTIEPIVHLTAPFFSADIDLQRLAMALPVPSTAIFSREDGLVAWESCRSDEAHEMSVEVKGKHVTICRNPAVLRVVARRLAEFKD